MLPQGGAQTSDPSPQYPTTPQAAGISAARPHRILFMAGVATFVMAGVLGAASAVTWSLLAVLRPTNLGPDLDFGLQSLLYLAWAVAGAGALLAALAMMPESPRAKGILIAGGVLTLAGSLAFAVAELLLFYTITFARFGIEAIQSYSSFGIVGLALVPVGLAILFVGLLRAHRFRARG